MGGFVGGWRLTGWSNEVGTSIIFSPTNKDSCIYSNRNLYLYCRSLMTMWNFVACNKFLYLKKQRSRFVTSIHFGSRKVTPYLYLRVRCYLHLHLLPHYIWSRNVTLPLYEKKKLKKNKVLSSIWTRVTEFISYEYYRYFTGASLRLILTLFGITF